MPLVSELDDVTAIRPANPRLTRKLHNKPVQYNPGTVADVFGDQHDDVPFSTPPVLIGIPDFPGLRSFTKRPMGKAANQPMNYVPLKSDQEGSRPDGAALFNAPYPRAIQSLPPKEDGVRKIITDQFDADVTANVNFVNPLEYELGIRPGVRVLKRRTPDAAHFLAS